jgi:MFS family permease
MITQKLTSKENFKSMLVIWLSLIGGQVFFGLIAFYLNNNGSYYPQGKDLKDIFIYLVPVFAIYGLVAGSIIFKKRLNSSKNKTSLLEKLNDYRAALIIRYALLEGATFFSLVSYLMTGDQLFLYISILIIAMFIILKPSAEKVINDMELNPNERQMISNPNSQIT